MIRCDSPSFAEVDAESILEHPNLIHFEKVTHFKGWWILCMKYAQGGDLVELLEKNVKLSECEARKIFIQLLEALYYLHSMGFVHRDVKLDNLLLDSNGTLILTDFEFSQKISSNLTTFSTQVGTFLYSAPEMRNGHYQGTTVDMWAAGVTLFCLLYGNFPFSMDCLREKQESIWLQDLDDDPSVSTWCKDLLRGLLQVDPTKRLTAREALSHPWCTGRFNQKNQGLKRNLNLNLTKIIISSSNSIDNNNVNILKNNESNSKKRADSLAKKSQFTRSSSAASLVHRSLHCGKDRPMGGSHIIRPS